MAIIIDKPKSQKKLIAVLIFVLAATAAVLYFGLGGETVVEAPSEKSESVMLTTALKWDFPIFNDERFKALKSYFVAIEVQNKGRANPFIPYEKATEKKD